MICARMSSTFLSVVFSALIHVGRSVVHCLYNGGSSEMTLVRASTRSDMTICCCAFTKTSSVCSGESVASGFLLAGCLNTRLVWLRYFHGTMFSQRYHVPAVP